MVPQKHASPNAPHLNERLSEIALSQSLKIPLKFPSRRPTHLNAYITEDREQVLSASRRSSVV